MTGHSLLLIFLFVHIVWTHEIVRLTQTDQYRQAFINLENELWTRWQRYPSNKYVNDLLRNITNFEQSTVDQLPQNFRGLEPLEASRNFKILQKEFTSIDYTYKKFKQWASKCMKHKSEKCRINGLVDDVQNNETGINATMFRINYILYQGKDNITELLYQLINETQYWCKNITQSPQQLYYNFYNLVSVYQLKAYILWQVTNLLIFLTNDDNKIDAIESSLFAKYYYSSTVKNNFYQLKVGERNRDIQRCDQHEFLKGKNFDQFTRMLQGYIENEITINKVPSCANECEDYIYVNKVGKPNTNIVDRNELCYGTILNCRSMESSASICMSNTNERRYEYVSYENGNTLGLRTYCTKTKKVNSWNTGLSHLPTNGMSDSFTDCNYCMCLCDQPGIKSDRYINMRPVYSDIKNNRVVTGIRFKKRNRLLHLQVQQGKLLPYGQIDQSTIEWVEVENYTITDEEVISGNDFFTMKWSERSMAMNDVQVDDKHIVTGVRFTKGQKFIELEVRAHEYDWLTGQIRTESGQIFRETIARTKIEIDAPDVPTRTDFPSRIHNEPGKYVEFTHTDFKKDLAQTTIPFIDLQEVVTKPAVPLSGVGLFYRGNPGFGGFVAPKIKTLDYGRFLTNTIPERPQLSFVFEYTVNE